MLLEALIAILIFSVGVLAIVRLQGYAVKQSTDAEFRSLAAVLANDLISRMWGTDRAPETLKTEFGTPSGGGYQAWYETVAASGLPNVSDTNDRPTVTVENAPGLTDATQVTITMTWRSPGDDPEDPRHSYVTAVVLKQD